MSKVQILLVNTGATPITTEKLEFPASATTAIHDAILSGINRLGKQAHALLKHGGNYWIADHTARKGPSKEFYKHSVKYHPYMKELV